MNLIINGPGRSGTTLLSRLLSYHQDFGWISGYVNRFPNLPVLSVLNFLYRIEFSGVKLHKSSKLPKPAEAYNFWNYYLKQFNDEYSPTSEEIVLLKKTILKICNYQNKTHFVTKITGSPRTNIFNEIFTDYKVLWIERDPRVVVSSFIKQKWFYKSKPDEFEKLTTDQKILFYADYYNKIYCKTKNLNCKIIFYEDLCKNPLETINEVLEDYNLEFTISHKRFVSDYNIKQVSWEYYKNNYDDDQVKLLNKILEQPLNAYNYI